jgi:ubiquinone/menaquinone biosynthesis C-methylase UbiE
MIIPNYFKKYIQVTPFALALWRSQEAMVIAKKYNELNNKFHWINVKESLKFRHPILDLGCGFGEFSGVFFEGQIEMGIDISLDDLIVANKINKYKKLVTADARYLPFKDKSFSTIVSISVLEHIPNMQKAIKEAYRVLKPGGIFIITMPTLELNNNLFYPSIFKKIGFIDLADWYVNKYHQIFKHINILTEKKWVHIVEKSGFKILSVTGTMTTTQTRIFDIFLITALPSQIIRWLIGSRGIWALRFKTIITTFIYNLTLKSPKFNKSNILIIAHKL